MQADEPAVGDADMDAAGSRPGAAAGGADAAAEELDAAGVGTGDWVAGESAAGESATAWQELPAEEQGADAASDQEEAAPVAAAADDVDAGDEGDDATVRPLAREFLLDPSRWSLWTAVAILRWMMQDTPSKRLVYRSKPALSFSTSEIYDVGVSADSFDLVLAAPGLAAPGSALPLADVSRIVMDADRPDGGALAYWLDGLVDRLMQAVEVAEARTNASFALATGGDLKVVESVLTLAGYSAPLYAEPGGVLHDNSVGGTPAPGLARMFIGDATAAGLESLVSGFTNLDVEVEEFVSVDMDVARPLRLGTVLDRSPIGREGEAAAGVNVILDGTQAPDAAAWVRDPARAAALSRLCTAFVGGASPEIFLLVDLAPEYIPPASLDGATAFGRAPVLGTVDEVMRLPIELSESLDPSLAGDSDAGDDDSVE